MDTRRRAASDLVRALCKFHEPRVIEIFSHHVAAMLEVCTNEFDVQCSLRLLLHFIESEHSLLINAAYLCITVLMIIMMMIIIIRVFIHYP